MGRREAVRPVAVTLGLLASIATILTYLHLEPPWVAQYLPRFTWPTTQSDAPHAGAGTFARQYTNGYNAARHRDFSMATEFYKAAIAQSDATAAERMKAFDALGYAYFRMRDYSDADVALDSALQIDPSAVVPRVNKIKVMCGRAAPAGDVQAALQQLRASTVGNSTGTSDVETDKELFQICRYAGVSPA
jgi:tetratricopeptide (TPR) repeat protein